MLVRTRSEGLIEGEDGSTTNVEAADHSTTVLDNNDHLTMDENTPTRSPESKLEKKVSPETEPEQLSGIEAKTVNPEAHRIFVGVDVLGETLPESTYLKLLTSKFAVTNCLKIMMLIIRYLLRKKGIE